MVRRWRVAAGTATFTLATAMLVPLAAAPAPAAGTGAVSLTALGTAATENFDTLATTGTANTTLPAGWYLREAGTNANDAYAVSTGSATAGDTYSFGATGSAERAFGGLLSGSLTPTVGAAFTNNTGSTLNQLDIAYTGEQWRLGASGSVGTPPRGPDRLDFQYSLTATGVGDDAATWVNVNGLDFTSPITEPGAGALNGNAAANRTAVSGAINTVEIAPGATVWVRWLDVNVFSSDDGLAVDDFSITPRIAEVAPSVISTSPADGDVDVALDANITFSFSEPVDVTDPWFTIQCEKSGTHAATYSGSPTALTIDPTEDFEVDETCTVTVPAARVTDQDTEDPPNAMEGDKVISFTTVDTTGCADPAFMIHDIQGNGAATPVPGRLLTLQAVVVGDYQGSGGLGGYYVQEEDAEADADPNTSEGIFVADNATDVSVGDTVRVRGRANEAFGQTRVSGVTRTTICATGASVTPAVVSLPIAGDRAAALETREGMRISITQRLTVTETFTLARFGEVELAAGGRLETPTNAVAPGAPAQALQQANDARRILLDDGLGTENPATVRYPQGGLSADNTLRVGDSVPSLDGVLGFDFSQYRIQPVGAIDFDQTNPRTVSPEDVGGEVKMAAFNVLNYFNGNGAGAGFPTPRGADNPAEFTRQRAKIINAIGALDADVVGLMELENDDTDAEYGAIEDLVDGLNEANGEGTYDFVDTGVIGTDEIRVGILYQPAHVTPVGDFAILDSSVDPRFIDTRNRPSLAQTFEANGDGAVFTAVVNHLKSKGSACAGDPELPDGQGNCNLTRTAAAEALVDWMATDPTDSGDTDYLLVGDMNAYAQEDPISVFKDAGFVDTINEFVGEDGYSYVFDGQSGYLDHALASPSLAEQVNDVTEWHINADEPVALDYNLEFKTPVQQVSFYSEEPYRASDHDPVLVGLDLNAAPSVDAGGPYAVVEGRTVTVTATGTDPDDDTLTYAWDLDGNGTFETPGQSATFSAAGLTAPDTKNISVQVTDPSGLTGTDTAVVDVIWRFAGFFAPVSNLPHVNRVRAGRAVPVKFSLGGDQGLAILDGAPTSTPVRCSTLAPTGPARPIAFAEALSYRKGTYSFTWKTTKGWSGCRLLTVALVDGTEHEAAFRF